MVVRTVRRTVLLRTNPRVAQAELIFRRLPMRPSVRLRACLCPFFVLSLATNDAGEIPVELSKLSALQMLRLAQNQLTGEYACVSPTVVPHHTVFHTSLLCDRPGSL